jgi:hypothetical protein
MSTAISIPAPNGALFTRIPLGLLVDLPRAARRCYEVLHDLDRQGRKIDLSDREFCGLLNWSVGRRVIQKGLRILEDLGIIARIRSRGRRTIEWLCRFATRSSIAAANAQQTSSPCDSRERRKHPGSPTGINVNLSGEQTARKIVDELQVKGWIVAIIDADRLKLEPTRTNPAPVGEDLARLLRMHKDDVRSLIETSPPARE